MLMVEGMMGLRPAAPAVTCVLPAAVRNEDAEGNHVGVTPSNSPTTSYTALDIEVALMARRHHRFNLQTPTPPHIPTLSSPTPLPRATNTSSTSTSSSTSMCASVTPPTRSTRPSSSLTHNYQRRCVSFGGKETGAWGMEIHTGGDRGGAVGGGRGHEEDGKKDEDEAEGNNRRCPIERRHMDMIDRIYEGHTWVGEGMNRLDAMMRRVGNGVNDSQILTNLGTFMASVGTV